MLQGVRLCLVAWGGQRAQGEVQVTFAASPAGPQGFGESVPESASPSESGCVPPGEGRPCLRSDLTGTILGGRLHRHSAKRVIIL